MLVLSMGMVSHGMVSKSWDGRQGEASRFSLEAPTYTQQGIFSYIFGMVLSMVHIIFIQQKEEVID